MSSEAIKRVENAIVEVKRGRMVIMMDDEDRENEGDLVYAATFSTPDMEVEYSLMTGSSIDFKCLLLSIRSNSFLTFSLTLVVLLSPIMDANLLR